jgi:protocatechuate 3,4-dioxygenase beta subunit
LLSLAVDGTGTTVIGGSPAGDKGLAYNTTTGILYGADNDNFGTIDPTNGDFTPLAFPGGATDIEGLTADAKRNLVYGLDLDGGLYVYAAATGTWSAVGNTGVNWNGAGLAYEPEANVLLAVNSDGFLHSIDPLTAETTVLGDIGFGPGNEFGLALAPAEPVLEGVTFQLMRKTDTTFGPSGTPFEQFTGTRTTTTDEHGQFWFTGLVPGEYKVSELLDQTDTNNNGIPDSDEGMISTTADSIRIVIESREEYAWIAGDADHTYLTAFDPRVMGNVDIWDNTIPGPGSDGVVTQEDIDYEIALLALKDVTPADPRLEFGNFIKGSIHGLKFEDVDADGKRDRNEDLNGNGVIDVTVHVSEDVDGDGHLDVDEPPLPGVVFRLDKWNDAGTAWDTGLATTATDASGQFWFTGLEHGNYRVVELLDQSDSNGDWIADTDQDMMSTTPTIVELPELLSRQEFVWADGAAMLPPDALQREVNLDPNPDPNAPTVLNPLTWGNAVKGSIHGLKFEDVNGDGIRQFNEPVLPNVRITLQKFDGGWQPAGATNTDANGHFWFEHLDPGFRYRVIERLNQSSSDTNQDGTTDWVQGMRPSDSEIVQALAGDGDYVMYDTVDILVSRQELVNEDGAAKLNLPENALKRETNVGDALEFGNYIQGSIHGFKFEDINGNGQWDLGVPGYTGPEPALPYVRIDLLDEGGNLLDWQLTDADGLFWFEGLKPGLYTAMDNLSDMDENHDGVPDDGWCNWGGTVTPPPGPIHTPTGGNACYYTDSNMDAIPDVWQGMESSKESFQVLVQSREEWAHVEDGAMLDWTPGSPDYLKVERVDPNMTIGNYITGSIHGFKFEDANANGVYETPDTGYPHLWELGMDWVKFEAIGPGCAPGECIEMTVVDNFPKPGTRLGEFWFTGLRPGEWTIRERLDLTDINDLNGDGIPDGNGVPDDQEGLTPSTPNADGITFTIFSRQELVYDDGRAMLPSDPIENAFKVEENVGDDLVFGNYFAGHIYGLKLHEDSGAPAPNITIELVDNTQTVVDTSVTDANGNYGFWGIKPGFYTVREVDSPSLIGTPPSVGVVVRNREVVTAAAGLGHVVPGLYFETINPALELLNTIKGSIHGIKVHSDTGEPIEGIPIRLSDMFGSPLASTSTDAVGEFWFEDLDPAMIYQVVELPSAAPVIGDLNQVAFTVNSGEEHVAYLGQATVHGPLDPGQFEVFNDKLIFENTLEGSIHGVVLSASGSPVVGRLVNLADNGSITTTTTDNNGHFWFEELEPGVYNVAPLGFETVEVTISSGEEESGLAGQAMLELGQYETVNPELIFTDTVGDIGAPVVQDVKVAGEFWSASFLGHVDPGDSLGYSLPDGADQHNALPWENINRIYLKFNEDIVIDTDVTKAVPDIALFDQAGQVPLASASFDAATDVLTIVTTTDLPDGRYMVAINDTVTDLAGNMLDGDFANYVDSLPSGNGSAGEKFEYLINISHADFTNTPSGAVDVSDLSDLGVAFGSAVGDALYNPFTDANGSGTVDVSDLNTFGTHFGHILANGPTNNTLFRRAAPAAAQVDSLFAAGLDEGDGDDDDLFAGIIEDVIAGARRKRTRG